MRKLPHTPSTKLRSPSKLAVKSRRNKIIRIVCLVFIIASLALIIYPYLPKLWFKVNRPSASVEVAKKKEGNRLVIENIGVDAQIIEGDNVNVLDKTNGVWHEPATANPKEQGNMVIAGHRFQYKPHISNYFYNLTEMKNGEKVTVIWNGEQYDYEIYETRTVEPTEVDIRDTTDVQYQLTLYTCTPLGSDALRYVVFAKRITKPE